METMASDGSICVPCGGGTAVMPGCDDPTASNFDPNAVCIDNTLCTYTTTFGIGVGGSNGDFGIADPCACNGDETYTDGTPNDVGTFNETIYIGTSTGDPVPDQSATYDFTVTTITANPAGTGSTAPILSAGATLTWDDAADGIAGDGLGFYIVVFDHTSNSGYEVMIDVTLDAGGASVAMLTIGNQCAYPPFALLDDTIQDNICVDASEPDPDDADAPLILASTAGGGLSVGVADTNTADPETGSGTTTFTGVETDDDGNMGVAPNNGADGPAYPSTVGCPAAITLPFTVVENDICTEVADIPTVGEWGLIILGLMMSIVAIVGIRARREEEAYS